MRNTCLILAAFALSILAAGCATVPEEHSHAERSALLAPNEPIWVMPGEGAPAPVSRSLRQLFVDCEPERRNETVGP